MTLASHVRAHKFAVRCVVALAFTASGLATVQEPALASARGPEVAHSRAFALTSALRTPSVDLPASPAMLGACDSSVASPRACDAASLRAIDAARASEGLGALELPAGYETLGLEAQLVAVTNGERTSRGLPAWHSPDAVLHALAEQAVASANDPDGPAGTTWASNTAGGVLSVLQADYEWMYDDGPGGTNPGCSTTDQSRCWSHRDNILSPWPGSIGAAAQPRANGRLVLAELMVATG